MTKEQKALAVIRDVSLDLFAEHLEDMFVLGSPTSHEICGSCAKSEICNEHGLVCPQVVRALLSDCVTAGLNTRTTPPGRFIGAVTALRLKHCTANKEVSADSAL